MKNINLINLLKEYKSGWVALSNDYTRVIDHADSFIDLQKKIRNKKDVIVLQASDNYYNFVS